MESYTGDADHTHQDIYFYDYMNYDDHPFHFAKHGCYLGNGAFTFYVVTLIIAGLGLPLTLIAIFAVYSMVRRDHVAPVFVVNLLVSDLIQVCSMIVLVQEFDDWNVCAAFFYIHHFGVMLSVCFMVVVSLERYLIIAWPLWYNFRQSIKASVLVCVGVWILPFLYLPIFFFISGRAVETCIAVFLLLPFPLLIFFLIGAVRALFADNGVPLDEKLRVVAIQVLVLLIYTLLFLPRVVFSLAEYWRHDLIFELLTIIPVHFSPLADLFLYVFMRKGRIDKLLASLYYCRKDGDDATIFTVNDDNICIISTKEAENTEVEKAGEV